MASRCAAWLEAKALPTPGTKDKVRRTVCRIWNQKTSRGWQAMIHHRLEDPRFGSRWHGDAGHVQANSWSAGQADANDALLPRQADALMKVQA